MYCFVLIADCKAAAVFRNREFLVDVLKELGVYATAKIYTNLKTGEPHAEFSYLPKRVRVKFNVQKFLLYKVCKAKII